MKLCNIYFLFIKFFILVLWKKWLVMGTPVLRSSFIVGVYVHTSSKYVKLCFVYLLYIILADRANLVPPNSRLIDNLITME